MNVEFIDRLNENSDKQKCLTGKYGSNEQMNCTIKFDDFRDIFRLFLFIPMNENKSHFFIVIFRINHQSTNMHFNLHWTKRMNTRFHLKF